MSSIKGSGRKKSTRKTTGGRKKSTTRTKRMSGGSVTGGGRKKSTRKTTGGRKKSTTSTRGKTKGGRVLRPARLSGGTNTPVVSAVLGVEPLAGGGKKKRTKGSGVASRPNSIMLSAGKKKKKTRR